MALTEWMLTEGRISAFTEATGVLSAFAHDRWFHAPAPPLRLSVDTAAERLDVPLEVTIPSASFEPEAGDLGKRDLNQLLDNLRGPKVLDVKHHPRITWRGRYLGDLRKGRLEGAVTLRGGTYPLTFDVEIDLQGDRARTHAVWSGKLTNLGITPFRALLGAIRLKDRLRIEIEAAFRRG